MLRFLNSAIFFTVFSTSLQAVPAEQMVRFRATVKNVTAGNVLSPFLSFVHKHNTSLFSAGDQASPGIAEIAETGATTLLENELATNPIVLSIAKAPGMPIPAAEKRSIEFSVPERFVNYGARLTILSMIGMSNDSFVAFQDIELKTISKDKPLVSFAENYDAGSEENSGYLSDFGPGGHPTAKAEGHISFDRGLNLRGNAEEIIGWGEKAAQLKLERID